MSIIKWSQPMDPDTWSATAHPIPSISSKVVEDALQRIFDEAYAAPTHLFVSQWALRQARKILYPGWHYKKSARWRYLVKRGARK